MSLANWLSEVGPKPGTKRKIDVDSDAESPSKRKFTKGFSQKNFDWYQLDDTGKWHCNVCRQASIENAYARGHDTPAKTTNHTRHASCKYFIKHLDAAGENGWCGVSSANLVWTNPI